MIYIIKQEGLYQNKVNSSLVSPATVKWAIDANESTQRLVDRMSTGLINTHMVREFFVLYPCSLENNAFSALRYVIN